MKVARRRSRFCVVRYGKDLYVRGLSPASWYLGSQIYKPTFVLTQPPTDPSMTLGLRLLWENV
jgi:hypothetical protein